LRLTAAVMRRGRGARSGCIECWTSACEAEVWRTGQLVSKRMDILVSRDFRVSKGARAEPGAPRCLARSSVLLQGLAGFDGSMWLGAMPGRIFWRGEQGCGGPPEPECSAKEMLRSGVG